MTGLQKPPKQDQSSHLFLRMSVLVLMIALAGLAVWAAVTNQRIDLIENQSLDSLESGETIRTAGLSLYLEEGEGGTVPVVMLHDFDVSGGLLWEEVAASLGDRFRPVRLDLPGFGLSQRVTDSGAPYTVAAMAELVGGVVEARYDLPVVVAGVGLGGEVAAELAVTRPALVRGLVMIDVDFRREGDWVTFLGGLPYLGPAVIHTFEAGGRFGVDRWAPRCDEAGWCPTEDQIVARNRAATLAGSTDSLMAFLETPRSSLVPSELDTISVPSAYVWSTAGEVTQEAMREVVDQVPGMRLIEADAWKAHLETPDKVIEAIDQVGA